MPPWSQAELIHKIKSARTASHSLPRGHLLGTRGQGRSVHTSRSSGPKQIVARPAKPKFCPMVLKRVASKVEDISNVGEFLRMVSPVSVDTQDSAGVLSRLYRRGSGEKVLIFSDMNSQGQKVWEADGSEKFHNHHLPTGDEGVWFLPQPVTGEFHANPRLDGKLSRRSEEAVTSWRYLVLESDEAEADDWLRCLIQIPLRIACICESGGRSIHALVRLDAESKVAWDALVHRVKPALVTLGADPGALSAVRLTRLPQARRGKRVQRLLYLNPFPDGTPIVRRGNPTGGTS
ncbi:MAG: hypothetical protein FJ194_19420 [Gammaproteobacteria bacterium]|nr:hypothetical protein [Gammaproteobacteria bacterium]